MIALLDRLTDRLTARLLEELGSGDHWSGNLSSSALSTAVAVIALQQVDPREHRALIQSGLHWLAANANPDGGWGDTIRSKSNISTTALCWAAFGATQTDSEFHQTVHHAEQWLARAAGSLAGLPSAIAARYGKDRTFSVPILVTLAISGRLPAHAWRDIPALPFELSVLPRRLFGALKLPVVSYALPALIAIGHVIHRHAPSRNPLARNLRNRCAPRALQLLGEIQPPNGGFLEATPLTAFVTMSMAAAGQAQHIVTKRAVGFLRASVRSDGSWPIDTNLATWVTTLSVKALSHQKNLLPPARRAAIRNWLLRQQTQTIHPYTGAAPGAWAWTDLPGGVPDADDTAGALIALPDLGNIDPETISAAERGIRWLLTLQNGDGGIPTFCRGWGTLPFDRSTPEITAHALRAFQRWRDHISFSVENATNKALRFLARNQRADGAFIPLWFGNEHADDEENPVYGTAQVLIALNELPSNPLQTKAARFLLACQNPDGSWGGAQGAPGSIEETALALEALSPFAEPAVAKGLQYLLELPESRWSDPAPIGLYFARLWYYERLYPLIFSVSALGRIIGKSNHRPSALAAGVS